MTSPAHAEVIGDPVDHSLSPAIHGFWLKVLGIDAEYGRRRVVRTELPAYLAEVRGDSAWRGSNITMPLKLDAVALADEASDLAVAAGAANVLMIREGRLVAANTDVGAVALLLGRLRDSGSAIGGISLLGTGGAARAALVALKLLNLHNVRIQARDMTQAYKLAVEFGLEAEPGPLTAPIVSDGIINATPLGMTGWDCLNCDLSNLPPKGWVFDMVTDPPETPLIAAARERGMAMVTGIDMLVEQAAASFKLFFDADPPRDRDAELWQLLKR